MFYSVISTSASDADEGAFFIKWLMLGDVFMFASDLSNAVMDKKIMMSVV